MAVITLRNGTQVDEGAVGAIYTSLHSLLRSDGMAFVELVEKCRDESHRFFGDTEHRLQEVSLVLPDGSVHDVTKAIVVSAVEGEGANMSLHDPVTTG